MSDELGFIPFDADNHYYEALDAFTRHLDPKDGQRCVQWAEILRLAQCMTISAGTLRRSIRWNFLPKENQFAPSIAITMRD
jgi:hypothetical protein